MPDGDLSMSDLHLVDALPTVRVLHPGEVAWAAAELIAGTLADAVAARGVAHWATTGGSAAPGIYAALETPPLRERVPWDRVHTWWGDDRFVGYDDPLSNVLPLETVLLRGVAIPPANLHRWPIPEAMAAGLGPEAAAERYANELAALVTADDSGTPVFDLLLVGVGPDGHLLSVFPGSAVWDEPSSCVAVPAPTHVEPHVARVTLHPRVLPAARSVLVVTAGASKAVNLGRAWTGDDVRELPVRAARLGTATWILDEAAAAALPRG